MEEYGLNRDGIQIHIGTEDHFIPARKAHPALEVENLETLNNI